MTDTFTERSYGSIAVKLGIVVVDYQRADPAFPLGGAPLVERGVQNTARLLAVARQSNVPVATCFTAYWSERDMPHWAA